jgi:cytochrome P450
MLFPARSNLLVVNCLIGEKDMQNQTQYSREAPSIKGLPIVGNLFNFGGDPVEFLYAKWQQAGNIFNLDLGPRVMCVISNPILAQEILIEKKQVFQRPRLVEGGNALVYLLGHSILTIDGDLWLPKRRLMQPIFHKQRIQAMNDNMVAAGREMLKRWEARPDGEPMNLSDEMKLVTLDIINCTMFSTDILPDVDRVGSSVDIGLHYISNRTRSPIQIPTHWPTPGNLRFKRSRAALDGLLYRIIRERRASQEHLGDLLDMLLEARDEETGEGMNDEQVRNEVATIYGAGHETTAVALTWAWYALNQHPEALQKLQEELDHVLHRRLPTVRDLPDLPYTLAVFEETMRLFPPVPMTVRFAFEPSIVGGYSVPEGTLVNIAISNIHQHPDYWEEPRRYMPERFLPENRAKLNRIAYIPFLTGPHLCIGINFALTEGPLLLAMMAQCYNLKLVPGQQISRDVAVTMRPKHGLRVQPIKRNL